jgi:hypothetical protein
VDHELYASESFLQILLVTGVIGGGAAFLAGRAIAQTWRPFWTALIYMAMLGAAVRFVHFALFEGTLLSPPSYVADTLYLIAVGSLAWRMTRAAQMATQYYWLYERTSLLTWRNRSTSDEIPAGNRPITG